MLSNRKLSEEQTLIRRQFTDFFESERFEHKYHERIQGMIVARKARLLVDMGDLLDFYIPAVSSSGAGPAEANSEERGDSMTSLGRGVIQEPGKYVPLLELALHDVVLRQQPEYLKIDYRSRAVHVGFEGPVGSVLSPRELYARHLNTVVALEGIIIRQSSNRPRVLETVHYCPDTNKFIAKEFRDQLTPLIDSSHLPTVNVMPKTDMEGHALRTELGLSTFMDSQCAILQEAPERAPTGQLPRNVELRFDDDLVDTTKPGDRVQLVGVYMSYTTADSKSFQSIVLVNHVVPTQALALMTRRLHTVEERLKQTAQKWMQAEGPSGVLKTLAKAVAPTIYGMQSEKRAIVLMMAGGVERQAHNTHVRGDINLLLVGEPSTAKSQLLRFVLGVAPLALSTTGKGSSGVGLTAAVAIDAYTGERSLSAGAMVLADRGILCVDEFDKMSAQDRVAMHEAMEQQTVTIAKAGIHASLNARCSVLAAANPIYGFYSVHHKLVYNVGLPESLLSRFDLTFIVLDQRSSEHDRRIGRHILRNHMTSKPVGFDPVVCKTVVGSSESADAGADLNPNAGDARHSLLDFRPIINSTGESIVSADFLKAYVQLARQSSPLLTETSQQLVSQHYVQLRAEQEEGGKDGFFVTARTLESILRLSTAHAKLRLSPMVEECDVNAAMELLRVSVHAATSASQQREEGNRLVLAEGGAPSVVHGKRARGSEDGEAAEAGRRTSEDSAAMRGRTTTSDRASEEGGAPHDLYRNRDTGDNAVATAMRDTASALALSRRVVEALKEFQREQRGSIQLKELHERLGSTDAMADLQHAVSLLQGDAFIYESVEEGGNDLIQFI